MADPYRVPKHGEKLYDYIQWWEKATGKKADENIDPGDPRTYNTSTGHWENKGPEPTITPGDGGGAGGGGGMGGGGGTALLGLQTVMPPPEGGSQLGGFRTGLGQRQNPPLVSPLAGLQRIY